MIAYYLLWRALTKAGARIYNTSFTQDQANIIFNIAANAVMSQPLLRGMVDKVTRQPFPKIVFSNGSYIEARSTSHHGDYLRGYKAHTVVVDEASFVDDTVVPAVIRPMLIDYSGNLILISTPFGHNYFYEEYHKGETNTPGYKSFKFPSSANPYLPRADLEFAKQNTDELTYANEYGAEFIDDQNMVFKWEVLMKAIDDYEYAVGPETAHTYVMGVDVARKIDYTTIAVIDISKKESKLVYMERFNERNVGGVAFWDYVCQRIVDVAETFNPFKVVIDSSSAGNPVTQTVQEKIPQVEEYSFSNTLQNPKKVQLISLLKLALEQGKLRFPADDKVLIDEFKFFGYKLTDSHVIQMEGTMGRHDDQVIAVALAWSANSGAGELIIAGVETGKDVEAEVRTSGTLAVDSKKDFYGQNYEYGFGNAIDFVSVV